MCIRNGKWNVEGEAKGKLGCPRDRTTVHLQLPAVQMLSHRWYWYCLCLPHAPKSLGHGSTGVRNRKGQQLVPVMGNSISSRHRRHLASPFLVQWALSPVCLGFYTSVMWWCYKEMHYICKTTLTGFHSGEDLPWNVSGLLGAMNKKKEEEDKYYKQLAATSHAHA